MSASMNTFFSGMAEYFSAGNFDAIAGHFAFPTAIYFEDKITVFETPQELVETYRNYKATLEKSGYSCTTCKVVAQSLTMSERKSVWVDWSHHGADTQLVGQNFLRFFLSQEKGAPVTIMLAEYLELPLPPQSQSLPHGRKKNSSAG